MDYENFTDEEELKITEKYTKETKLYVLVIVGNHKYIYLNIYKHDIAIILALIYFLLFSFFF